MGTYAVTGSASGMGREVAERLRAAGHRVIGVDLHDAEIIADLATPVGRRGAADEVLAAAGDTLDGAVLAAGIGPSPGRGRARLITQVNFVAAVELLEAWRSALGRGTDPKVVVFGSNSTTTTPLVPGRTVRALLDGDPDKAARTLRIFGRQAPVFAYAASKIALSRWVRRRAVTVDWVGAGIRLNALAPGAIRTPLLEEQLADPATGKHVRAFPVPTGGFGDPGQLAEWVVFMLSPAAEFLCGSVITVDGGTDALFRADDWPRPVPIHRLRGYLRRMKETR